MQEDILSFVRRSGPIIPATLAKDIGKDIFIASAMLSELVDQKKLKLSALKVGGTPVYFLPGDEPKLEGFISHLNPKDRQTAEILRDKKVLKETDLDPLTRVSLRQIRDFAVPLDVNFGEATDRFWKWAFISNADAEPLIKGILGHRETPRPMPEQKEPVKKAAAPQKEPSPPEPKPAKQLPIEPKEPAGDPFLSKVEHYFKHNDIEVVQKTLVRQGEADFIVMLNSTVGRLTYYCKAKSKKKITDSDLSSAYVQGEMKKLPVLFLSSGELTKKAKDMCRSAFVNMSIKKL
ncbi:MAG: hypothetical protein V1735_05695 [Nanoarchaeota archaeon]